MLLKLLCVVSLLTFLGTGVDATCGSTLSTYLTRSEIAINSTLEHLYVSSPYSVSVVSGNEFAVIWNGTDAGDVENLIVAGQSANITLVDSTTTAGLAPRPPRKAVSTADRSTVRQTINVLALVLSFGAIQYLRKGFAPLFVVIIALSMANLISSTVFSSAPCPDATITLQIPEATIRFICVNNEPCICGPGYYGNDCTIGSAPVATPISNPPSAAPVTSPVAAPVNPPMTPPVASPSCNDTMKNGLETDVDCGGGTCPKCVPNQQCSINNDCDSSICSGNVCQQPTCTDATKNGLETDKDCGGTKCPKCGTGSGCLLDRDCSSSVCTNNICQQASCTDNTINGGETDVDCGGGTCPGCLLNETCQAGRDCASGLSCDSLAGKCIDACADGVKNNSETDVDCGGSTCSQRCITGQGCNIGSDCASGQCSMFKCQAPPSA